MIIIIIISNNLFGHQGGMTSNSPLWHISSNCFFEYIISMIPEKKNLLSSRGSP